MLFFFSCLSWLEPPVQWGSGGNRHPCPVPDLRGKASSLFTLSMMLDMLCRGPSIRLGKFPSIINFLRVFIMNGILLNACFVSIEMITRFLFCSLLIYSINWFGDVKPILHLSCDKSHFSWYVLLFMYYYIPFASIDLRVFASVLVKRYWAVVFLWCLCLVLVSG